MNPTRATPSNNSNEQRSANALTAFGVYKRNIPTNLEGPRNVRRLRQAHRKFLTLLPNTIQGGARPHGQCTDYTQVVDDAMCDGNRYPKINYNFDRDVRFDNFIDNQLVINLNDHDDEDDDDSSTSSNYIHKKVIVCKRIMRNVRNAQPNPHNGLRSDAFGVYNRNIPTNLEEVRDVRRLRHSHIIISLFPDTTRTVSINNIADVIRDTDPSKSPSPAD
ncbi:unnamed protein product [Chrysodeixis includens]|uniref:Uncharacterized protein n=1 Tax=Chrysodeixis includens TaxID=689277 RepID=A0A9N8Q1K8_CHRIL|nr:unnamed protein product [Chrysodeixis includens]